ncbi:MAG: TonB family protein [Bacteroidia bacterium]|nr:TonB family protein [Bacteroidia bacterium]
MKSAIKQFTFSLVFIFMGSALFSQQIDENGKDRTESPYFEVPGKRGVKETLPLLSTSADANIAGVIASVKVTQVYVNRGKKPIEASYIFPLSTRAAVYAMQFTLGKRIVKAQIQDKDKAQQIYDDAKSEGKTASLLQQHRPNVFQMNVANIMPGDTIRVELFYSELLMCENGIYEFVYPTVVGPRYTDDVNAAGRPNEKWVGTPYTQAKVKPTYLFDIKAKINGSVPLAELNCTSHDVDINYEGATVAQLGLKKTDKFRGNKDFILHYRLTGNKVQEGVLLYEGGDENYFLMMMQPPKTVTAKDLPGREYIFILDVSGSQNGFPLEISKELMKNIFTNLKKDDKFNVLVFEGYAGFMSDSSLVASPENINKAITFVNGQRGSGATNLMAALKKAMTFPRTTNYSRTFAIATDGFVSFEKDAFTYIKSNLGDANFFTFGIGSSINRFIIEGMAHAGMAEPMFVTKQNEASATAEKFRKYISNPVLTNIKVTYDGFNAYDIVPVNVPDVFAMRPIIVFGKYKGTPSGTIKVSGITAAGNYSASMDISSAKAEKENIALRYLWARQKIREYDFAGKIGNKVKEEIKKLGLEYGLLTDYTSFVAVDDEIRNKTGKADSVVQPLPLPEGVSNLALGTNGVAGNTTKTNRYTPAATSVGTTNGAANTTATGGTVGYSYTWSNGQGVSNSQSANAPTTSGKYSVTTKSTTSANGKVGVKKPAGPNTTGSVKRTGGNKIKYAANQSAGDEMVVAPKQAEMYVVAEKEAPKVFLYAEEMPEYPSGQTSMNQYLAANIKYPQDCKEANISGKVYIQFTVDVDGTIKDIKVIKSPHQSLSDEAIRIIKMMPKWKAGKQNGRAVATQFTLPINFKLQ